MNLMLHGIEQPAIEARDSLSEDRAGVEEAFTMVLANPPFKGSVEKSDDREGFGEGNFDDEDRAVLWLCFYGC